MAEKLNILSTDFVSTLYYVDSKSESAIYKDTETGDLLHFSLKVSSHRLTATVEIERDDYRISYHECSGTESIASMIEILNYSSELRWHSKDIKIRAMRTALSDRIDRTAS